MSAPKMRKSPPGKARAAVHLAEAVHQIDGLRPGEGSEFGFEALPRGGEGCGEAAAYLAYAVALRRIAAERSSPDS